MGSVIQNADAADDYEEQEDCFQGQGSEDDEEEEDLEKVDVVPKSNPVKNKKKKLDFLGTFIQELKQTKSREASSLDYLQYPVNDLRSKEFEESFSLLLRNLAAWTNLKWNYFDAVEEVPTSCIVETNFSEIKTSLKEISKKPMRMDKFLTWHCDFIDKCMLEAYAIYNSLKSSAPKLPK